MPQASHLRQLSPPLLFAYSFLWPCCEIWPCNMCLAFCRSQNPLCYRQNSFCYSQNFICCSQSYCSRLLRVCVAITQPVTRWHDFLLMCVRMHAGLSMLEQEQRWDLIRQGRAGDYHGVAVHPRHLSLFEKAVLKRHRQYRRQADVQKATPCDSVHTNTDVQQSPCTIQASQLSQLRQAKAQ